MVSSQQSNWLGQAHMHMVYIATNLICVSICDWLWENPPVTHKDNYLEKRN